MVLRRMYGWAGALALGVALGGCGGDDQPAQTAQGGPGGGGRGPGMAGRVAVVEVQPVTRGSIARQVTVAGVVDPVRTIGVNSQLAGAVNRVLVEEGDLVRAGTVLARMDARELAAQLAAAEAQYEVTRAAYERADQLRERRVITEKRVESGDVVGNQARLFTIADVSELVVRVGVSELDVVELSQGDPAIITLDAVPNQQLRGRIRRIFPTGDPTTRLVPVEVVFDAQSARVARPGFLARVTFDLATSEDVLLLPVSAVLGAQGAQSVFIVENGTAARRPVTTGLTSQGRIEIVSGLAEGEPVVVMGNNDLRDGMSVRVAGSGPPPADSRPAQQDGRPRGGAGPAAGSATVTPTSGAAAAAATRRQ